MTAGLSFMKNVLTPLAKNVSLLFGLSTGMSVADAAIQIYESCRSSDLASRTTELIISNEEMEEKGGFLTLILGTLASNLLGSALTLRGVIRAGEGVRRAGQDV